MPAKKPILNLILLGDPGAGKATQAAMLSKRFSFFDLDMGRELALQRQNNPKIDAIHKKITDKGKLTPTWIVRDLFRNRLDQISKSMGIVFDGTPKMLGEAKLVAGLLKKSGRPSPIVIYIKIPEREVVERVTNRKGYFNAKFSRRSDDTTEALRNRAKYYRKNIKEVVEYFQKIYPFTTISGIGNRTEVNKRLLSAITKLQKKVK